MSEKLIGVTTGVAGIFLWFMPLASWTEEFLGVNRTFFQTGQHIGGIAYLLLFSMFAYSVFSWLKLHPLRIITGVLSLLICFIFLTQIWPNIGWGLLGLFFVSILGTVCAIADNRKEKIVSSDINLT